MQAILVRIGSPQSVAVVFDCGLPNRTDIQTRALCPCLGVRALSPSAHCPAKRPKPQPFGIGLIETCQTQAVLGAEGLGT